MNFFLAMSFATTVGMVVFQQSKIARLKSDSALLNKRLDAKFIPQSGYRCSPKICLKSADLVVLMFDVESSLPHEIILEIADSTFILKAITYPISANTNLFRSTVSVAVVREPTGKTRLVTPFDGLVKEIEFDGNGRSIDDLYVFTGWAANSIEEPIEFFSIKDKNGDQICKFSIAEK